MRVSTVLSIGVRDDSLLTPEALPVCYASVVTLTSWGDLGHTREQEMESKRTAEQIAHLRNQIEGLWRYLGHTEDARRSREKATEWKQHAEDLQRELSTFLIQTHAETVSYFRVVTAVAYAGYFGTWGLVNRDLPQDARFAIALLGIISLGVFGLWEVFAAQRRLRELAKMGAVLRDTIAPDIFEERKAAFQAQEARFLMLINPIWKLVMFISIASLLLGGGIMVFYFLVGITSPQVR